MKKKIEFINFLLPSSGASTRMEGEDKGLVMLEGNSLIRYVLDSIDEFLTLLNLENKIAIHIVLNDHIQ